MPTIADLIVTRLRQAGVRFLFGVPGGGSNLELIESARRRGVPFVLTATETAAAIAAVAQTQISGRLGACLTTLGPGVASVVNGIACAKLERTPLIVLTDGYPTGASFEHQRLDHRALLAPVTKWSAAITAAGAEPIMARAVACALEPPPGPVHIECPADIPPQAIARLAGESPADDAPAEVVRSAEGRSGIEAFEPFVAAARKPLVIAGLGAAHPADAAAIRAFCDRHNLPAMVTYRAKGVVPDFDRHFAGVFTNGAIEAQLLDEADLLIGAGLDPVELIPRPWTCRQPIVYCGRWPVSAGHVPFASQVVADVASVVRALNDRMRQSSWDLDTIARQASHHRQSVAPVRGAVPGLMPPHDVVLAFQSAAAVGRVTVDAGAHMFPATILWPVNEPNRMLVSNGLSTMGFALPAAIGAALLDRSEPVVALTGDGGLLMCAGELLTAVREKLHIVTVVFNDSTLSLIDLKQRQRGYESTGVLLGGVTWSALAESLGMAAYVATNGDELRNAILCALGNPGPSLIDVHVDPSTYPDTLRSVRG